MGRGRRKQVLGEKATDAAANRARVNRLRSAELAQTKPTGSNKTNSGRGARRSYPGQHLA